MTVEPLNLVDFAGGLNLRETAFLVDPNESPAMLNIALYPRGGISTRAGWSMVNAAQVVPSPTTAWRPRNAELHAYSNGKKAVFITNANKVWAGEVGLAFVDIGANAQAIPHMADIAGWGDKVYIACGVAANAWRIINVPTGANPGGALTPAAAANWNDNYTTPIRNVFPKAMHAEAHSGYMFVAHTQEDGTIFENRLRWSHPNEPEDWAKADYIDILQGGSKITAIRSFRDHLLIFKENSVWALYGYERDSWQLIRVSISVGTPSPVAVTRSESACYFYSASGRNGIYVYHGDEPTLISEQIRRAMDQVTDDDDVFLGWAGRRLLATIPHPTDIEDNTHSAVYAFDPQLGNGAWTVARPAKGSMACIVENADASMEYPLIVPCGCTGSSGVMRVGYLLDDARDHFLDGPLGFRAFYRTSWQHAGWPERQKSWLRPRLIMRTPDQDVSVRMDTFWNYDPSSARRSHVIDLDVSGAVFWRVGGAADPAGDGADWGEGAIWGARGPGGDLIVRARPTGAGMSLGWARSVQLEFSSDDPASGRPWAVDAIILKFNARRFTT